MIIVTGAAGFIGSNLVSRLNQERFKDIILVDDFSDENKNKNIENKIFTEKIHRDEFLNWLPENHKFVQYIFHIGARTNTTEFDKAVFDKLNLNYSKQVWDLCCKFQLPLVYASSAATYGDGSLGYDDNDEIIQHLKPLNPYGESKNEFDKWILQQNNKPFFWAGLKFFNVYGPNEYHKGRMASVVFHAYNQIKQTGKFKLFKSHRPDFKDGEQSRDFIYVNDVIDVLMFFLHNRKTPGIYNLGTGKARTFIDLVTNTFKAMELKPNIEFVDTPADIRDKYQYFTEANMGKLRLTGYTKHFYTLEDGIFDYVRNYLISGSYK